MALKILVLEAYPVIREGLKKMLLQNVDSEIFTDTISNRDECFFLLQKIKPDVIVLDPILKRMNDIDLIREIRSKYRDIKIIIFSFIETQESVSKAMDAGANAYLNKMCSIEEFSKACSVVITKHGKYIQESIYNRLRTENSRKSSDRNKLKSLTKRELEILTKVSRGMLNKEIANEMNISERTVKNHLSNIFKKIEVSDRTQAAIFAIKNNVIKV